MLLVLVLSSGIVFVELGCAYLAVPRYRAILSHTRLAHSDNPDAVVHVTREDVLVARCGQSEDGRRKSSFLGPATLYDVFHLILLVLHVVNQGFLVSAHVLHDEIVLGVRKVPSRIVSVRRRGPLFAIVLSVIGLVEEFRGSIGARPTLAGQVGSGFGSGSACGREVCFIGGPGGFIKSELIFTRCV